jgi:hypothetical protein
MRRASVLLLFLLSATVAATNVACHGCNHDPAPGACDDCDAGGADDGGPPTNDGGGTPDWIVCPPDMVQDGPECTDKDECTTGKVCGYNGKCEDCDRYTCHVECDVDKECPWGMICANARPYNYDVCVGPSCGEGRRPTYGYFRCRNILHCPSGYSCLLELYICYPNGLPVRDWCNTNCTKQEDCPDEAYCSIYGECIVGPRPPGGGPGGGSCDHDGQCPKTQVCNDGVCCNAPHQDGGPADGGSTGNDGGAGGDGGGPGYPCGNDSDCRIGYTCREVQSFKQCTPIEPPPPDGGPADGGSTPGSDSGSCDDGGTGSGPDGGLPAPDSGGSPPDVPGSGNDGGSPPGQDSGAPGDDSGGGGGPDGGTPPSDDAGTPPEDVPSGSDGGGGGNDGPSNDNPSCSDNGDCDEDDECVDGTCQPMPECDEHHHHNCHHDWVRMCHGHYPSDTNNGQGQMVGHQRHCRCPRTHGPVTP